jgi:transposase-like protein
MSLNCPKCCIHLPTPAESRTLVVKIGHFYRHEDQSLHQRYLCRACRKSFSTATHHPCYKQKRRLLNPEIFQYLVSGVSQRRLAKTLGANRKTIVNKFLFLSRWADEAQAIYQSQKPKALHIQFDDLETFEHSKLKPLSVVMAVEAKSRRVLGFRVAQMPAKGLLVQKSLKKYGRRKDQRRAARRSLFSDLAKLVDRKVRIQSDQNPHYIKDVKRYFPEANYETFPGKRGCVTGQGELKAASFDPLFSLNHTFVMFRANINRLFRKTWNTTKKQDRLSAHLTLYCLYHNLVLIE